MTKPKTPNTVLLNAARIGDLKQFKKIASAFDDGKGLGKTVADIKDGNGRGALHFAAGAGRLNVCKYLIEELRFDVDVKDGTGETPLLLATIDCHLSIVKYLLEKGANPEISDDSNLTPLHNAAAKGHIEVIILLLSKGVHVDALNDFGTPLHYAATAGQHGAVKVLLDLSANPNLIFHHTFTPLQASIRSKSRQCVELLLQEGADPNAGPLGITPLILAVEQFPEIVRSLIKAGADPNVTNIHGLKPVEIAAVHGKRQAVEVLLPVTSRIPSYVDWSVDGVIRRVNSKEFEEKMNRKGKETFLEAKSRGTDALKKKLYWQAALWYSEANNMDPSDAAILSNRSMCYAHMGKGDLALDDAKECILRRPDWPKGYYRAGVALNILKKYDEAAEAFFGGLKLDPGNKEIEDAFREASEARLSSINVK